LINDGGTLYGTTPDGGATGNGTVFSVTTSGVEKVVYSFANGSDGAGPLASLVPFKGALYGTTQNGGTSSEGTVFRVTTSGQERCFTALPVPMAQGPLQASSSSTVRSTEQRRTAERSGLTPGERPLSSMRPES